MSRARSRAVCVTAAGRGGSWTFTRRYGRGAHVLAEILAMAPDRACLRCPSRTPPEGPSGGGAGARGRTRTNSISRAGRPTRGARGHRTQRPPPGSGGSRSMRLVRRGRGGRCAAREQEAMRLIARGYTRIAASGRQVHLGEDAETHVGKARRNSAATNLRARPRGRHLEERAWCTQRISPAARPRARS